MEEPRKAKLAFITDNEQEFSQLTALLTDIEMPVEFEINRDLNDIEKRYKEYDLLIYWPDKKLLDEARLERFLGDFEDPPGLILMVADARPQDYIRAAKLHGGDVVNVGFTAHFVFAVQREIINVATRRRLRDVVNRLEESCVVDETELHEPIGVKPMTAMVGLIDEALKNDGLELMFQPIIAVEDDGYDNYEIFLRIKNRDNDILPDQFLPVAEKYGLMPAIDRWVVQHAIYRFKAEQEVKRVRKNDDRKLRFFLNISGHSLVDEFIIGNIIAEIVGAKLKPGSIVIEVDKNTVLSRLQKAKSLNKNIKKLKLEFAIDHYEQSDNSLNYLRHIVLDYIKLSHEVIHDIHKEPEKRDSVREIMQKARENGIKVIASQIDDADTLPTLYDLGVDYIQGFAIAEPATRLEALVMDAT